MILKVLILVNMTLLENSPLSFIIELSYPVITFNLLNLCNVMSFRQVQFCSNNRALLILCQRSGASLKPSFEVAAVCVNRLH